jgi:rubrerythrin
MRRENKGVNGHIQITLHGRTRHGITVKLADTVKGAEMGEMANRKIFLEVCMGIEALCADLYHYYSEIYVDTPEAALLWKKTAIEEENHQRQFELALRLLDETEFDVSQSSLDRAYSIQCKLLKLTNHVKSDKPELMVAVSRAVEMEANLADLHAHTSLNFKEESMQNMFKALGEADRDHVSDMQRFHTILSLPNCDMNG